MKLKHYIFFIFLGLIITTCKKYPEDKFISIGTSKTRLDGEWQLTKIEINGEDVGYKYNDSLAPLLYTDYRFWFRFDWHFDTQKETFNLFLINKSSKKVTQAIEEVDVSGVEFGVNPKKESLTIVSGNKKIPIRDTLSNKILINILSDFFWKIRMLHNKKLIIEKNRGNNNYRIYFKKTRNH